MMRNFMSETSRIFADGSDILARASSPGLTTMVFDTSSYLVNPAASSFIQRESTIRERLDESPRAESSWRTA